MREILFRGKRTDNNKWYEGSLHIEYGETDKNGNRTLDYRILGMRGECDYVDPSTVGQYTGLTDKNGNKIFEGDMCRATRHCVLAYGKIAFRNGCFWFVDDSEGGMLRLCDVKIDGFQIEVIGNIHDNPEKVTERRGQSDIL